MNVVGIDEIPKSEATLKYKEIDHHLISPPQIISTWIICDLPDCIILNPWNTAFVTRINTHFSNHSTGCVPVYKI